MECSPLRQSAEFNLCRSRQQQQKTDTNNKRTSHQFPKLTVNKREANVHDTVAFERVLKFLPEGGASALLRRGTPHDVQVPEVAPTGAGYVP